jgi:hypothetical protein
VLIADGDAPEQMIELRTKKSSASDPLATAVALSRVSAVGVTNPVPSSGVWVSLWVKGPL